MLKKITNKENLMYNQTKSWWIKMRFFKNYEVSWSRWRRSKIKTQIVMNHYQNRELFAENGWESTKIKEPRWSQHKQKKKISC